MHELSDKEMEKLTGLTSPEQWSDMSELWAAEWRLAGDPDPMAPVARAALTKARADLAARARDLEARKRAAADVPLYRYEQGMCTLSELTEILICIDQEKR